LKSARRKGSTEDFIGDSLSLEPNGGKISRDKFEHNGVENFEQTLLPPTKVCSGAGLALLPVALDDDDGEGK